ncbi:lytic transglycosylase domain-containing protein [Angustibacter sp. Root456]|uniref:lytic transglycosylase domain-containing protein n=1 Tax=Angustibacter sp. Root456 TaxID=1736539 RepID=UPI0019109CCE|nr:lytic transglycosylase domain-containing protein [Angustibacter sp. Root456]
MSLATPLRRGAALALLVLLLAPAGRAEAEDAATARERATAAAQRVRDLTAQLDTADAALAQTVSQVGQQVSGFLLDDEARVAAEQAAALAADRSAASARALYLSGGQAGLLSSLLESGDVSELSARAEAVQQVLSSARATADDAAARAKVAADVAARSQRQTDAAVVTAAQIALRVDQAQALVEAAQATLDGLSARARTLTEAEDAARALAQARARMAAAQTQALSRVRAQAPPAVYFDLYHAAARTCRGMDWTLLAAVGQVESGHGRNSAVSSAGAVGPMQFMPRTFAAYAVDGDHDGRLDPWAPADAVYTAARYLCSGGAGSPSGVQAALLRYNHAQWYVDLVLAVQTQLRAGP